MTVVSARLSFPAWFEAQSPRIVQALCDYIAIDTTSPHERAADAFLRSYLGPLGFTFAEFPLPRDFFDHAERCPPPVSRLSEGATILRAHRAGRPGGRHLMVNAHVDVVPLQDAFAHGFQPRVAHNHITGRGAVDTKGNLVMFAEALRFLLEQGRPPRHAITLDLVPEEEIGGNGALASTLYGSSAECALVLEPTGGEVFIGHRGCVSFRATFNGHARHMGDDGGARQTVIDAAAAAVQALRTLETDMNADKATTPAFAGWQRALQINVGEIKGGEWYGSIPARCVVAGNCGFLPGHGLTATQQRLEALFQRCAAENGGASVTVDWPALRNEAGISDIHSPFVQAALKAAGRRDARAWNVSCDARHYIRRLGLPTVIFGCGDLAQAHAVDETLDLNDLAAGVAVITRLLDGALGGEELAS